MLHPTAYLHVSRHNSVTILARPKMVEKAGTGTETTPPNLFHKFFSVPVGGQSQESFHSLSSITCGDHVVNFPVEISCFILLSASMYLVVVSQLVAWHDRPSSFIKSTTY